MGVCRHDGTAHRTQTAGLLWPSSVAARNATRFSGPFRLLGGILSETLLAALIAPSMMIFQSAAVASILLGRTPDSSTALNGGQNPAQARNLSERSLPPTLFGFLMGASAFAVSLPLLLWMSPVIVGLVFAIPLWFLTLRGSGSGGLFATPEDRSSASQVVLRANRPRSPRLVLSCRSALHELREDADLLERHLDSLPQSATLQLRSTRGACLLAAALAKIEQCETFDEAVELARQIGGSRLAQ